MKDLEKGMHGTDSPRDARFRNGALPSLPGKGGAGGSGCGAQLDDLRTELLVADTQPEARFALVTQRGAYRSLAGARPAMFRLMFSGHGGAPSRRRQCQYVLVRQDRELAPADPYAATLAC